MYILIFGCKIVGFVKLFLLLSISPKTVNTTSNTSLNILSSRFNPLSQEPDKFELKTKYWWMKYLLYLQPTFLM